MSKYKLRVAISQGDINGISYELILRIFADDRLFDLFTPILYGSSAVASFWQEHLQIEGVKWQTITDAHEAKDGMLNILDCTQGGEQVSPGKPTAEAGMSAFLALERAVRDVQERFCDVLVTAPINKAVMPRDLFPFNGHTGYLQSVGAQHEGQSLMVLACRDCRVALATTHIPVSEVPGRLTPELIVGKLRLLESGLQRDFGIVKPRLAVLALNPHAGDGGLMGDEEELIIRPALQIASDEGMIAFGPYPADGFWGSGRVDRFDGILAMYHDQGLAPFKALYMSEGVNITLGLRFIRTSPDHGTGYDIAGKGIADPTSLREAIYVALDLYRARRRYDESSRNPLRRHYHNRGRDDEKLDLLPSPEDY